MGGRMTFELWQSSTGCTFFARDENYQHNRAVLLEYDAELVWTYEAKSHFDAMRAFHDYMGYEPYKPEPDWEDVVYD
jgi:hypothetical protein